MLWLPRNPWHVLVPAVPSRHGGTNRVVRFRPQLPFADREFADREEAVVRDAVAYAWAGLDSLDLQFVKLR